MNNLYLFNLVKNMKKRLLAQNKNFMGDTKDQTPMNKSVRLNICLLSDKIKLQNQSKATEGAIELKKEGK